MLDYHGRPHEIHADAMRSYHPVEAFQKEEQKEHFVTAGILDDVRGALVESQASLPLFAELYDISPKLNDYILVSTIIMPSDLPNRNCVAFPLEELLRPNPETGRLGFQSWTNKITAVDHCFPGDAPIAIPNGTKRIKRVRVGDSVFTHQGTVERVTAVFKNGKKWLSRIKVLGMADDSFATENHPYWIVDPRQLYSQTIPNSNTRSKKGFGFYGRMNNIEWDNLKPHFRPVSDMNIGDYVCSPIRIGGDLDVDKHLAFLTGVHMAAGCYEKKNGTYTSVQLTIGYVEMQLRNRIFAACDALGLPYGEYIHKKNNTRLIRIADKAFTATMLSLTGEYAHKKSMRGDLRQWNKKAMKHFLGGYISGDGSVAQYGASNVKRMRCRTASKKLAIDVQQALAFIGICSSVNKDGHQKTYTYMCPKYNVERTVRSKGSYSVTALEDQAHILSKYTVGKSDMHPVDNDGSNGNNAKMFIKGNYILAPVVEIQHKARFEDVYNFEVENEHSYVAYGVAVHNCNKDYNKDSKGIILGTFLKPIRNAKGNLHKVVSLLAFDRTRDSLLANQILTRQRTAYSMGAMCSYYTCSICGARHPESPCNHVSLRRPAFAVYDGNLAYLNARNFIGFETSSVISPAYLSAQTQNYTRMWDEKVPVQ